MSRAAGYSHALRRKIVHSKVKQLTDAIFSDFATIARTGRYIRGSVSVDVYATFGIRLGLFYVQFDPATPDDPSIYHDRGPTQAECSSRISVDTALDRLEQRATLLRDLFAAGIGQRVRSLRRQPMLHVATLPGWRDGAPPAEGPREFFACEVKWEDGAREFTLGVRRWSDIELIGAVGDFSASAMRTTKILRHTLLPVQP